MCTIGYICVALYSIRRLVLLKSHKGEIVRALPVQLNTKKNNRRMTSILTIVNTWQTNKSLPISHSHRLYYITIPCQQFKEFNDFMHTSEITYKFFQMGSIAWIAHEHSPFEISKTFNYWKRITFFRNRWLIFWENDHFHANLNKLIIYKQLKKRTQFIIYFWKKKLTFCSDELNGLASTLIVIKNFRF